MTGSIQPQPCPIGTYGNSTRLRRSQECTPCPGGQFCDGLGLPRPRGLCDAGFFCREKAFSSVGINRVFLSRVLRRSFSLSSRLLLKGPRVAFVLAAATVPKDRPFKPIAPAEHTEIQREIKRRKTARRAILVSFALEIIIHFRLDLAIPVIIARAVPTSRLRS